MGMEDDDWERNTMEKKKYKQSGMSWMDGYNSRFEPF